MNGAISLRQARAERLLSIRELARAASVAPSTIYLTETGRTVPRPSVVWRLTAVLGIDPRAVVEFGQSIERASIRRGPARPPHADPAGSTGSPVVRVGQ